MPGALDRLANKLLLSLIEIIGASRDQELVPNLGGILRVELTLELGLALWDRVCGEIGVIEPTQLLVDLALLPVLRTGVVGVTSDHELVGHSLALRKLHDGTVDDMLGRQAIELQLQHNILLTDGPGETVEGVTDPGDDALHDRWVIEEPAVQVLEAVLLQLSEDLKGERTTDAGRRDNEVVVLLSFLEHREIDSRELVEALRVTTTHKPEELFESLTVTR